MPRIAHCFGWRAYATPAEAAQADMLMATIKAMQRTRNAIVRRCIDRAMPGNKRALRPEQALIGVTNDQTPPTSDPSQPTP